MPSELRDITILKRIIQYCYEIDETNVRFGNSKEKLEADNIYKNALSMCILQIGELATNLTDGFRDRFNAVPWKKIKAMRNIAVHRYFSFDVEELWNTVSTDIVPLWEYCKTCIDTLSNEIENPL